MVILPIRSFRDGKSRLAESVGDAERDALVRHWAETVAAAAHELAVLVVSGDHDVLDWAERRGLAALQPSEPGLDQAADQGRAHAHRLGYRRVMIAHADLPRARDLRPVFNTDAVVVIVPDVAQDGTNVLVVPTDDRFIFSYGPGSFERHRDAAVQLGWVYSILEDPDLAVDIDDASDLTALRARIEP